MKNPEIKTENLRFAYLKYIQMTESLGFYPTEEQEPDFDPILTDKQLEIRYNNARKWYKYNYGQTSKLYKLIFGKSSDLKKLKKMLERQNFNPDRINELLNLL